VVKLDAINPGPDLGVPWSWPRTDCERKSFYEPERESYKDSNLAATRRAAPSASEGLLPTRRSLK